MGPATAAPLRNRLREIRTYFLDRVVAASGGGRRPALAGRGWPKYWMARGRPSTPTAIRVIEGNQQNRPINKKEPKPKGVLTAPKTLSPGAKAHWQRITLSMPEGVYAPPDEGLLAAWCEARANHDTATAMLKIEPMVVLGSTGQPTVSPWVKIQSDMARQMVSLAQQLGFNPSARAKLHAPIPDVDEDGDNIGGSMTFN